MSREEIVRNGIGFKRDDLIFVSEMIKGIV